MFAFPFCTYTHEQREFSPRKVPLTQKFRIFIGRFWGACLSSVNSRFCLSHSSLSLGGETAALLVSIKLKFQLKRHDRTHARFPISTEAAKCICDATDKLKRPTILQKVIMNPESTLFNCIRRHGKHQNGFRCRDENLFAINFRLNVE